MATDKGFKDSVKWRGGALIDKRAKASDLLGKHYFA
jgi:hypothetical protein